MDIDSLSRIALRNIQKAPISRPALQASKLLELLERLQLAENSEHEDYSGMKLEMPEDQETPVKTVPFLPSLQPLQSTSDNPKEIIFDAFLCEQNIPSLTNLTQNKISLLLKAIPLAVNAQPLLTEECSLMLHFLDRGLYDDLQNYVYQKLMHGYLASQSLYAELVVFLLNSFTSFEVAGEVIRRLPIITDDVWKYIWKNSQNLLHLLKDLVMTYEEGSRGIDDIFAMMESGSTEIQDHAISLIVNQLYSICPDEINKKTIETFISVCVDLFESSNYTSKIRLFFKLLSKNPDLLECLIDNFEFIKNPSHKRYLLEVYAKSLNKKIPQSHPILVRALDRTNDIFSLETLNILGQLSNLDPQLKIILMNKIKTGEYQIIQYLAPHMNLEDVMELFPLLISLNDETRNHVMHDIVKAPSIDICELLVLVLRYPVKTPSITKIIRELMEMRHVYTSEILQKTTEKVIRLEPIPHTLMYFILKANDMYPLLKSFFINYALPYLLERKLWETETLWRGCVTFIENTVPDSIHLLELMPSDVQSRILSREAIKKGKLEESLKSLNKR